MSLEVERAFVAARIPPVAVLGSGVRLRQGYLASQDDTEVRIRLTTTSASLTVKVGSGLTRTEIEVDLPFADGEVLWSNTAGRRLDKARHRVVLPSGETAEVDVYAGELAGLCRIEVEFTLEAAAAAFEPPDWFGREVTGDPGWRNASLARHGRPH